MNDKRREYQDRLMDLTLQEKLGDRDESRLAERILQASTAAPQAAAANAPGWSARGAALSALSLTVLIGLSLGTVWRFGLPERMSHSHDLAWNEQLAQLESDAAIERSKNGDARVDLPTDIDGEPVTDFATDLKLFFDAELDGRSAGVEPWATAEHRGTELSVDETQGILQHVETVDSHALRFTAGRGFLRPDLVPPSGRAEGAMGISSHNVSGLDDDGWNGQAPVRFGRGATPDGGAVSWHFGSDSRSATQFYRLPETRTWDVWTGRANPPVVESGFERLREEESLASVTDLKRRVTQTEQGSVDGSRLIKPDPDKPRDPANPDDPASLNAPVKTDSKPRDKAVKTWRRAEATPHATRLVIGEKDELVSEGLQASVVIDGFRARVLIDYYFYNDRDRPLEGAFKLRLPNQASLFYFAFGPSKFEYRPQVDDLAARGFLSADLVRASGVNPQEIFALRSESWQSVKEARMVPRGKAAYAYAETTRRRIDPALVEWAGAGVFNARVFPLLPHKLHRIVVGYDVNLSHDEDDLTWQFDLPKDVGSRQVDLNVAALPGMTADVSPHAKPFTSNGRAYYHFQNPDAESIRVRIRKPGTLLLAGDEAETGDFFATQVTAELPDGEQQSGAEHAIFLLDTSFSSTPARFNLWVRLLRETLTRNRQTMKRFALLTFNVESRWWQPRFVANTKENVRSLDLYVKALSLEGATDLHQALQSAVEPTWVKQDEPPAVDLFLLSDGNVTWGEANLYRVTKQLDQPHVRGLFAYQTGMMGTATPTLEHLARETGGAVFSVTNEEEITAAATAHLRRPWRLLNVSIGNGRDVLVAGRPRSIYPHQRLLVVGRGQPLLHSQVVLHVKQGDQQRTVRIPIDRVVSSDLTPRAYGQIAVGQLEELQSATGDISTAYARHFRVTGQTCSLLMLESEADYERFQIRPEQDAFVVKSTPAADTIARSLDNLIDQIVNARKSLLNWLARLESLHGVQFKVSTALKLAIEKMPDESFEVPTERLTCGIFRRDQVQQAVVSEIADKAQTSAPLDYEVVWKGAVERCERRGTADGLKLFSSLVEHSPGDVVVARDVAWSALDWGLPGHAYPLLRRVAMARPYQPQAYQALGQCLTELGRADLAMIYYEVALSGRWDSRFGDFRRITAVEYQRLLRQIANGEVESHARDFAAARLDALQQEYKLTGTDLVVTLQWSTDRTDIDLHVVEPSGEECCYRHQMTKSGGQITSDVTEGLGPEMFTLRQATSGKYAVKINYYGSDQNRTGTRTKALVTIYEGLGTKREQVTRHAIAMAHQKSQRRVTTIKRP